MYVFESDTMLNQQVDEFFLLVQVNRIFLSQCGDDAAEKGWAWLISFDMICDIFGSQISLLHDQTIVPILE